MENESYLPYVRISALVLQLKFLGVYLPSAPFPQIKFFPLIIIEVKITSKTTFALFFWHELVEILVPQIHQRNKLLLLILYHKRLLNIYCEKTVTIKHDNESQFGVESQDF